ncbi:MAG: XTP/dITP diphosphatase [Ignavibacteria bacterium]
MKKIFIASKNKGKLSEIKSFLGEMEYEIFSLLDAHEMPDIEETGNSFEENALLKARSIFNIVKIPVIADDSGLEVDYLNGAPGIYSARYSGENATDKKNNDKLLKELKDIETKKRTAAFKCVICLYDGLSERFFDGVCEGIILTRPKGEKGFGYDPLFVPNGYTQTFAELGPEIKNRISHRGKALLSLEKFLKLEEKM